LLFLILRDTSMHIFGVRVIRGTVHARGNPATSLSHLDGGRNVNVSQMVNSVFGYLPKIGQAWQRE
jgi:hypothetical protein